MDRDSVRSTNQSSDSATILMRKMGRLDSSSSSICHSEFCLSLREMLAAMSAQVPVSAFHAALRSAHSVPNSDAPEYLPFRMRKK